MKKQTTIMLIVIVNIILIGGIVTIYFTVWRPEGEEGYLSITGLDEEITISIDELSALPNISRDYLIQGTPTYTANYTGVSMYYLLTEFANISTNIKAKVKAIDGYSYSLSLDELNTTKDIIIAYMKNNESIKSGSKGGDGPLRLIIPQGFPGEYNGQYCVKYVTTIEIIHIAHLTITGLDEDIIYNAEQLTAFPNISQEYTIQSSHTTFTANFTGVSVYYLITEIANISTNVSVKVISVDNYSYTLTLDELNETREIIIAYLKNSQFIRSRDENGEGPLRLIIPQKYPGDFNYQYCVQYVTTLEIIPLV